MFTLRNWEEKALREFLLGILSSGVFCLGGFFSSWCGFSYGLTGNKGIWCFVGGHLYCLTPKAVRT